VAHERLLAEMALDQTISFKYANAFVSLLVNVQSPAKLSADSNLSMARTSFGRNRPELNKVFL
jgi:hypothetical protein